MKFSFFVSCILLLGILTIVGNSMVLSYCWKKRSKSSTYLACKASLAFTDILSGWFKVMLMLTKFKITVT